MEKEITHIVIGDIHGRTNWKELIDVNKINIFVGDYFDPYEVYGFNELKSNFLEIIDYKKKYPNNFILLYGNHDYHYIDDYEKYSRYNIKKCREIKQLFEENKQYFYGVCYYFDNYMVSHAGISKEWYEKLFGNAKFSLCMLEDLINTLWFEEKKRYEYFGFRSNAPTWDVYGEYKEHSPLWIRPQTLELHNLFDQNNVKQIIGHTQVNDVCESNGLIYIDCLGNKTNCFKI